ncbi:hypothetical protein MP228_012811 [Amoeboaphelidium protococcarum]|nr:hypothetical protein MP228_012811 [Amoeboaphelidium protococcarum]
MMDQLADYFQHHRINEQFVAHGLALLQDHAEIVDGALQLTGYHNMNREMCHDCVYIRIWGINGRNCFPLDNDGISLMADGTLSTYAGQLINPQAIERAYAPYLLNPDLWLCVVHLNSQFDKDAAEPVLIA